MTRFVQVKKTSMFMTQNGIGKTRLAWNVSFNCVCSKWRCV